MIALALAVLAAQPGTLPIALVVAKPGDTVNLKAGDHGAVRIVNRKGLTLNWMPGATGSLAIIGSTDVISRGGLFTNPGGYAVQVQASDGVSIVSPVMRASARAMVIDRSTGVAVTSANIAGMTIDGINIASSQRVKLIGIVCRAFNIGKEHPDCIQGWSRPATGITSDVLIQNSDIEGNFQGIFFGNHVRNGVDDGGYDRITVRANRIAVSFPQGLALYDCRACSVTGNTVRTLPGARWKASMNLVGGSVVNSGNTVGPKE